MLGLRLDSRRANGKREGAGTNVMLKRIALLAAAAVFAGSLALAFSSRSERSRDKRPASREIFPKVLNQPD